MPEHYNQDRAGSPAAGASPPPSSAASPQSATAPAQAPAAPVMAGGRQAMPRSPDDYTNPDGEEPTPDEQSAYTHFVTSAMDMIEAKSDKIMDFIRGTGEDKAPAVGQLVAMTLMHVYDRTPEAGEQADESMKMAVLSAGGEIIQHVSERMHNAGIQGVDGDFVEEAKISMLQHGADMLGVPEEDVQAFVAQFTPEQIDGYMAEEMGVMDRRGYGDAVRQGMRQPAQQPAPQQGPVMGGANEPA